MKKQKVFISNTIPEIGVKMLKNKFEVVLNKKSRPLTKNEWLKTLKGQGFNALLTQVTDKVDETILESAGESLKIVANYAVGFDNFDLKAAKAKNIMLTNTPGVLTEAVGEFTFTLLMAATKHIVQGDKFVREGDYKYWESNLFLSPSLWGKTIGLVGLGRIGSFVAQIAREGYKMEVLYYDTQRNPEFEMRFEAKFHDLDYVLRHADFVSLHVPFMPSTFHMIGYRELRLMKKSAILINTSRGPVVDEKTLVKALKRKWIGGAALDVYEFEPKLARGLKNLNNVVLTPHIASATIEARDAMAEIAAKNIIEALEGRTPPNLIK